MKNFRAKPVGWQNESHRHYLAAKGIKTRQYNATKTLNIGKVFTDSLYDSIGKRSAGAGELARARSELARQKIEGAPLTEAEKQKAKLIEIQTLELPGTVAQRELQERDRVLEKRLGLSEGAFSEALGRNSEQKKLFGLGEHADIYRLEQLGIPRERALADVREALSWAKADARRLELQKRGITREEVEAVLKERGTMFPSNAEIDAGLVDLKKQAFLQSTLQNARVQYLQQLERDLTVGYETGTPTAQDGEVPDYMLALPVTIKRSSKPSYEEFKKTSVKRIKSGYEEPI